MQRILEHIRVLIIDDDDDARDLVQHVLASAGADVHAAANAADGFEALKAWRPDVLVSDIGMPEEDGFSLMRRVRALDVALGGCTPAVALTAFAGPEHKHEAMSVGFSTHMAKPVDVLALVEAVRRLAPAAA